MGASFARTHRERCRGRLQVRIPVVAAAATGCRGPSRVGGVGVWRTAVAGCSGARPDHGAHGLGYPGQPLSERTRTTRSDAKVGPTRVRAVPRPPARFLTGPE